MQVKNNASFPVIAICSVSSCGEGENRLIQPGASAQVLGPPIANKIEGRICYFVATGVIICHDNPDNHNGFHVAKGHPLHIGKEDARITILHHLDMENYTAKQPLCDGGQK